MRNKTSTAPADRSVSRIEKRLIKALLAFRERRADRSTALSRVYYDEGTCVASDGSRLLLVCTDSKAAGCFYLSEEALESGDIVPEEFDLVYPDYRAVMPRIPRLNDFLTVEIPDWLAHYSRSANRKKMWTLIGPFGDLLISSKDRGGFRLELLDALHGMKARVYEQQNKIVFQEDSHEPIWRCVLLQRLRT